VNPLQEQVLKLCLTVRRNDGHVKGFYISDSWNLKFALNWLKNMFAMDVKGVFVYLDSEFNHCDVKME